MDTPQAVTHIGLCAGYGGIELGLHRAIGNMRTVALCEIEAFAIANLVSKMEAGLMDPAPIWPDLKTFPWATFRDRVDILTGGYPCQPFSAAGQRKGKQDPRHLWPFIADGIRLLKPKCCFFENVEGHISLGLSDVIEDLAGMGYRTTWGIFSASECGAPHQRKRVFILAVASGLGGTSGLSGPFTRHEGQSGKSDDGGHQGMANTKCGGLVAGRNDSRQSQRPELEHCSAWPSRPGEQQYGWEPPRVVANTKLTTVTTDVDQREKPINQDGTGLRYKHSPSGSALADSHRIDRSAQAEGREHDRQAGPAGEELGDARCERQEERQLPSGWSEQSDSRQTQPALGLHADECSGALGQTLTLTPHGDNVDADENISKKARAREVLFEVWQQARTKGVRWETGRLQCFLEEKVLQSGVQLDGFTQRICFFVWCLQTGHQVQGWGLRGMHIYESSRGSSQGQEPIEQLKRELGYAMCQLSYEIALERGENLVETEGIMQGVRESSERAWALSQALPEMEEVWRSTLDQTVWENGCFVEATSTGNRTDELRLLGNGVVPATAERAFRTLMRELDTNQPVS